MNNLTNALDFAKKNKSNSRNIDNSSQNKPENVVLFNHTVPTGAKEAYMIDRSIFYFPNIKSLNGAIIKDPKDQYVFCDEVFDCVALGGILEGKTKKKHIFVAHVYVSILDYQIQNIVDEILKTDSKPEKIIYSPREDTLFLDEGLLVLKEFFPETVCVVREVNNEAEMIIGREGIILNDKIY